MWIVGCRSLSRSVCVVAVIMALLSRRACFWRLYATIFAVSLSSVVQNSSSIHHWAVDSMSLAILYRYFCPSLSWLYVRRNR